MIDMTPLDVRNKRGDFKRIMRGYDPQEVDVFLELAAERLEALVRENLQLKERTQTLQQQVDAQVGREHAVQEALVTAQKLRADIETQSEREAEHLRREAEIEARRLVADAEAEARRLLADAEAEVRTRLRGIERQLDQAQDSIQEMERRRGRFLKEFRSLLERELDVVQVEEGRRPYEERTIDLDLGSGRERPVRSAMAVGGTGVVRKSSPGSQGGGGDSAPVSEGQGQDVSEGAAPSMTAAPSAEAVADEAVANQAVAKGSPETDDAGGEPEASGGAAARSGPVNPPAASPASDAVDVSELGPPTGPPTSEVASASAPPPHPPVSPPRPSAPPAAVGDEPSTLELELMAGASGGDEGERGRFADIPDLETLLAEAGVDEAPPSPKDIAPPPAPGVPEDNLILFDPNDPEADR